MALNGAAQRLAGRDRREIVDDTEAASDAVHATAVSRSGPAYRQSRFARSSTPIPTGSPPIVADVDRRLSERIEERVARRDMLHRLAGGNPVTTIAPPSSVVLRFYTPTNAPQTPLTVSCRRRCQARRPRCVRGLTRHRPRTADPDKRPDEPASSITGTTSTQVSITAATALTTLRIVTQRAFVQPDNGKGS